MKFSGSLASLVFLLPLLVEQVSAGVAGRAANKKTAGADVGAGAAAANATAAAAGGDAQSSLTLDPAVIAKGFENDGQDVPTAGQVASATSSNNFINFCLTVPGKPITNGQQIKTGSCNPAPMGVIAATTNMPSAKFQFPTNLGNIPQADTKFTITMAIKHLQAGNFVNAASNYYSAPQTVNSAGDIIGHSHFVVEKLDSITQTTPTDPNVFAFFKGVNGAAVNGVLSVDVDNGLPAGTYRLTSINAAANHQPVVVAVAQHGSTEDAIYFTVGAADAAAAAKAIGGADAAAAANSTAAAGGAADAAAGAAAGAAGAAAAGAKGGKGAASSTTAAAAAASSAAAGGKGAAAGGKGGANNAAAGAQGAAAGAKGAAAGGNGANNAAAGAAKGGKFGGFGGRQRRSNRLARDY